VSKKKRLSDEMSFKEDNKKEKNGNSFFLI